MKSLKQMHVDCWNVHGGGNPRGLHAVTNWLALMRDCVLFV